MEIVDQSHLGLELPDRTSAKCQGPCLVCIRSWDESLTERKEVEHFYIGYPGLPLIFRVILGSLTPLYLELFLC